MTQGVINDHTDENIKNYLSEEKTGDLCQSSSPDFKENKKRNIFRNKKAILTIALLALIAVSLLFYFTRMKGKQSFDETKVKVSVETLSNIASGEEVVFYINYENKTNVDLKNAKISFFVPIEFLFISSDEEVNEEEAVLTWSLQNIPAMVSGNIKLFGKVTGELNKEYNFNSKISYTPENFNYEFESDGKYSDAKVKISSVPFELFIQSPQSVISGDEIEYIINYKNISDYNFKFVSIEIQLPDGFIYSYFNVDPDKKEENFLVWNIKNLSSGADGKFIIKGKIETDMHIKKEINVALNASEDGDWTFKYASENAVITVQEIPISIKQFVNGSEEYFATKGEELEYTIKFKNVSSEEIKGLVINSELAGEIDLDSFDVINGYYNKESNKIVWSALNIPKLASLGVGEEDEVSFKIKVKDYIEIKNSEDKNFVIKNTTTVNSFNFNSNSTDIKKIIASSQNTVKLKAFLFIKSKGYFNDDGRIKNTGVIPPETGKETNYLIHWNVGNLFNTINDVKIVSVLPKGVSWTGNYIKSDGEVSLGDQTNGALTPEEKIEKSESVAENTSTSLKMDDDSENNGDGNNKERENQIKEEKFFYNTVTREVIWEMPKLDANTGIISPAKEVVFQIRIKPTELDIGKALQLMNDVKAISYDEFTEKEIEAFDSELTTKLPDDYSIGIKEGIVISGVKDKE